MLSAARSWVFNKVVSARVEQDSWQSLLDNEPACLDGSNSIFISDADAAQEQRLKALDIHPSAPMWGQGAEKLMSESQSLHTWELGVVAQEQTLCDGLERVKLDYRRRSIRSTVRSLDCLLYTSPSPRDS